VPEAIVASQAANRLRSADMKRIGIVTILLLGLGVAGCSKKTDGGSGSAAAGSATTAPSGAASDQGSAAAASGSANEGSAGRGSAPSATGVPDCDAWIAAVDKIAGCDKMKDKADAIRQTADLMRQMLPDLVRSGDAKKIKRAANECKTNLEVIKYSGCPL